MRFFRIISILVAISIIAIHAFADNPNYYRQAENAFVEGNYENAAKLYQAEYVMNGTNVEAKIKSCLDCIADKKSAQKAIDEGNIERAKEFYGFVLKRNPKDKDALKFLNSESQPSKSREFKIIDNYRFNGFARVKVKDKWGVINRSNDIVVPIRYDSIGPLSAHDYSKKTRVSLPCVPVWKNGIVAFVNLKGVELTEFKYEKPRGTVLIGFPNPYYPVELLGGSDVFVDFNGIEYSTTDEASYGIKGLLKKESITHGPYNVGDYYCENGNQGIVFDINDDGFHGKIVNFDTHFSSKWGFSNSSYGCLDKFDGEKNTAKLRAAGVCSESKIDDGWYMPASNELLLIREHFDEIQRGRRNSGRVPMSTYGYLVSSTENAVDASKLFVLEWSGNNWEPKYENKGISITSLFVHKF